MKHKLVKISCPYRLFCIGPDNESQVKKIVEEIKSKMAQGKNVVVRVSEE